MSQSSSMPDFSGISRNDQLFLGAGLLAFIFSFIDFAHAHVSGLGSYSGTIPGTSITAWHGIGAFAALLVLLALIVGVVRVFSPSSVAQLPVPARVIEGGLSALALLFFLIRWVTLPSYTFLSIHAGFSLAWGGYVTLVLTIVMIVAAYLGIREAGEPLPWQHEAPPASPAI